MSEPADMPEDEAQAARIRELAAALKQQKLLATAIEHMPMVVNVVHRSGELVHRNRAARELNELLGDSTDWRVLRHRVTLAHLDGRPVASEELPVMRAFSGETPPPLEMKVHFRDDLPPRYYLSVGAPLPEDDGTINAAVSCWQDVTALHEAAELKDRFLAMASHELRSPLASMQANVQMLEMDPSVLSNPERRLEVIGRLRRHTSLLLTLVEQLFERARFGGDLPLCPVETDLVALCRDAIALAPTAGPRPVVRLDAPAPVLGKWDPIRLVQVVTNLIQNALRYSDAATPVTVRVEKSGTDGIIEVIDQGIGIDSTEVEHLFTPYFRSSNVPLQGRAGLGLGLHISSEIVKRHRGTIEVESQLGIGSVFRVVLPLRRADS